MNLLQKTAETQLQTEFGIFQFLVFHEKKTGKEHIALVKPWYSAEDKVQKIPLVRIHSECATGDIFASRDCDCRQQLHQALRKIGKQGGVLLYLRQEGRGIGLTNKIKAYELQRKGLDTVEANRQLGREDDERGYDLAVEMLQLLRIPRLQLLTNNPEKIRAVKEAGFQVKVLALKSNPASKRARRYLQIKKEKMGHILD